MRSVLNVPRAPRHYGQDTSNVYFMVTTLFARNVALSRYNSVEFTRLGRAQPAGRDCGSADPPVTVGLAMGLQLALLRGRIDVGAPKRRELLGSDSSHVHDETAESV